MTKTKQGIETLPLSLIVADPNQPRKDFDPRKLGSLMSSIQKHGIRNPLIVQKQPGGKYILVDGERRYRASKELKLKEVPVIIEEASNETDRLILQFHIQEQHEGWTPIEKALAASQLAVDLNVTPAEMSRLLDLPASTIGKYLAVTKLLEKKEFVKNEISLDFVKKVLSVRLAAKQAVESLDEEFTTEDESDIELSIINRIKAGQIRTIHDFTRIRDSFLANPKMVDKFLADETVSPERMFLQSKAKAVWLARNIRGLGSILATHIKPHVKLV